MARSKAASTLLRSRSEATAVESAAIREVGRRCACFNLRRVTRAVTQVYDEYLRPTGLRVTQFTVLVALRLVSAPAMFAIIRRPMRKALQTVGTKRRMWRRLRRSMALIRTMLPTMMNAGCNCGPNRKRCSCARCAS